MLPIDFTLLTVIVINSIVSIKGFKDRLFFEKFMFHIGGIKRGEQVRMVSSGFLHVDEFHLIFNMLTLFFFAPTVIANLGAIKFLVIYVASLIIGNIFSFYFHKDEYHYTAVGASGAVSGVLYAAILFEPMGEIGLIFIPFLKIPAFIFGILYLLYSIYGMKKRFGNIGHDAHFGGAVSGYGITLLLAPWMFQMQPWIVGVLGVPIVILFILQQQGKL